MKKYSLIKDSMMQIDQNLGWDAIKAMDKQKLEYADERIKAEASDIMATGFGYLNMSIMLLYVLIPVSNHFLFHDTIRVETVANLLPLVVMLINYILLYRFARKGIVRGNAAAGATIWGCAFPFFLASFVMGVDNEALEEALFRSDWFVVLLTLGIVLTVVMYMLANRAYNRAMNAEEE